MDDVQAQMVSIGLHDLLRLVFAQQAVIHEHAGELIGLEGAAGDGAGHGAVHAAGQARDDLAGADLPANFGDHAFDGVLGAIAAPAAAHAEHEIAQHRRALDGMSHLGMELHAVEAAGRIGERRDGTVGRGRVGGKALGQHAHAVAVVHEHRRLGLNALEQRGIGDAEHGVAVLAHLGGLHPAAAEIVDELHAVADAQHRNAQMQDLLLHAGRALGIDAVGAAGQDDAAQRLVPPLLNGHGVVENSRTRRAMS